MYTFWSYFKTMFLCACIVFIGYFFSIRRELPKDQKLIKIDSNFPNYTTFLIFYLPCAFIMLIPAFFLENGVDLGFFKSFNMILKTIVLIMIYYPIVYLCLKPLRKYFRARTVALLWTLPNIIYFAFSSSSNIHLFRFYLSKNIAYIILGIWALGFILVLGYYIIMHFKFKKEIKNNSNEINDIKILAVLSKVKEELKIEKYRIKLYYDEELNTPLSFDQFIVLPSLDYNEEELYLIFKHELIHISRGDPTFKFQMVFCKAICWFNPFIWKCLRKSAEDMELSCDEAVIDGLDDPARKKYATLILNTVGDERGFTTCLSASGEALKYRLSHIVNQSKKKVGYILVLFTMVFILMSLNVFSIGIGGKKLEDTLWKEAKYKTTTFYYEDLYNNTSKSESIAEYLNTFDLYIVDDINEYEFDCTFYHTITINAFSDKADYCLYYQDHILEICRSGKTYTSLQGEYDSEYYYIKEDIDIEYIESILNEK